MTGACFATLEGTPMCARQERLNLTSQSLSWLTSARTHQSQTTTHLYPGGGEGLCRVCLFCPAPPRGGGGICLHTCQRAVGQGAYNRTVRRMDGNAEATRLKASKQTRPTGVRRLIEEAREVSGARWIARGCVLNCGRRTPRCLLNLPPVLPRHVTGAGRVRADASTRASLINPRRENQLQPSTIISSVELNIKV